MVQPSLLIRDLNLGYISLRISYFPSHEEKRLLNVGLQLCLSFCPSILHSSTQVSIWLLHSRCLQLSSRFLDSAALADQLFHTVKRA